MAHPSQERDEAQRREALDTLARLRDTDTFATSALARAVRRAGDHLAARDAVTPDGSVDAIELWGRRIGRILSLAGLIALALYLYLTWLR